MSQSVNELEKYRQDCMALIASCKTLLMATRNGELPEVSYAPYIRDEEGFYIFISELAQHTFNLQQHSNAGVMFIQDEAESPNLFARPRVTFDCDVSVIEPRDSRYDLLLDRMEQELGKVVDVLRSLSDFRLFVLQPTKGRFVAGFGNAFDIDPIDCSLTAVNAIRKDKE